MSDTPISDAQFDECANMGGKWDRLREVSRDFERQLAEIKRQAGDATEFVLAQINADLRAQIADLKESLYQLRTEIDFCREAASKTEDSERALAVAKAELQAAQRHAGINERAAQLTAHRACCGTEHDPSQGKLHGCCVVCGVPWPCAIANPNEQDK